MRDLSNIQYILLNAPAGVGKDYAIYDLQRKGYPLVRKETKDKLHQLTMSLFNVPEDRYWHIYNNRELKEEPLRDFTLRMSDADYRDLFKFIGLTTYQNEEGEFYLSIRSAMIYVSEVVCKPRWGSNFFGVSRVASLQPNKIYIDGSCAAFNVDGELRADEVYPLIDHIGQDNILLVRIHRPGFTFDGDSREYVPDGVCTNTVDVCNDGTELEFYDKMEDVILEFLNNRDAFDGKGMEWRM